MAQYCRYCEFAEKHSHVFKCRKTGKYMYKPDMKHTNRCKEFKLNPVDVMRENVKGYKPTGRQIVQFGGLGEQIKLEDIINA